MYTYKNMSLILIFASFYSFFLKSEDVHEVRIVEEEIVDAGITRSGKPCNVVIKQKKCCPPASNSICGGINQYAYIANIDQTNAGQIVSQGANVLFNTNGLMTSGFFHSISSNTDQIVILNPGTYKIIWQLDQNSEGQWALFLTSASNPTGSIIPASIYGAKGSDEITGHAVFCLSANDIATGNNILVLRNYTSFTPFIILEARVGGVNATVNAVIYIEQLNCSGQSLC